MAKRLVKIAKELNVGTSSIVEHLQKKGFDIDNKPTAKISEAMESELLKEFSRSAAIKQEAEKINIGTRPTTKKEEVKAKPKVSLSASPKPKISLGKPSTPPEVKQPEKPKVVEKVEPKVEAKKAEPAAEKPVVKEEAPKTEEKPKPNQIKVLGKIDLDKFAKKPKGKKEPAHKKPKPEAKKEAKPKTEVKPTPKVEQPIAKKEVEKPKEVSKPAESKEVATPTEAPKPSDAPKAKEDGEFKAKVPQLRGLKQLGKIDIDKFSKKPKPKKKDDKKAKTDKPGGSSADGENRRRRRKRKVVKPDGNKNTASSSGGGGGGNTGGGKGRNDNRGGRGRNDNRGGRGGRRDEKKEVSKKEIEDKIKATMARLQGGGKNKRQSTRRQKREVMREKQEIKDAEQQNDKLQVTEFISVSELASLMNVNATEVIMTCMNLGYFVTLNQRLDAEVIEVVASEFNHEVEFISAEEQLDEDDDIVDAPEDLSPRSPIVTVMGHVDHGKTSLLDYIRKANVADGEAGGITQHIGAYMVKVGENEKPITFLDTPGHEAFTAMRARGAKVTDVAIIIISADDRVMPQTKEAISHAQAAEVPMVFAINKIDKPGADPNRIKQELSEMNILVEEWGGKFQSQDISAKQGLGIEELLEKVILEAEVLELQANPNREANGVVLEASLDKGRGYVSKILVQGGTLKIGDSVVAGEHSGKVKAMFNERGQRITEAGPSTATLLLGLSGAPQAGEKFKVMESEQAVRQLATKRAQINREQKDRAVKRITLGDIQRRMALGSFKELNLIVKGDVDGSVEALADSLLKLSVETVQVNIIHKAVGQIIESDVTLASASDAIIIGFQVRPSGKARQLAEVEGVEIRTYSIIYETIDEIKAAIEGMLDTIKKEEEVCEIEIRETFKISKIGTIAGSYVQSGKVTRNTLIKVFREGTLIFPKKEGQKHGQLASLKRFKDDAKEVKSGMECGLSVKGFNDIQVGDVIVGYEIVEIKQKLK